MTSVDGQDDLRTLLERYIAGDLSPGETAALRDRIASDPKLRSALDEYELTRYMDGGLSEEEAAAFVGRVNADPRLRSALAEYRSLERAIAEVRRVEPVVDYTRQRQEILAAVRERAARRRYRAIIVAVSTAVAAAILLGVFFRWAEIAPKTEPSPVAHPDALPEPVPEDGRDRVVISEMVTPEEWRRTAATVESRMTVISMPAPLPDDGSLSHVLVSTAGGETAGLDWIDAHRMMLVGG